MSDEFFDGPEEREVYSRGYRAGLEAAANVAHDAGGAGELIARKIRALASAPEPKPPERAECGMDDEYGSGRVLRCSCETDPLTCEVHAVQAKHGAAAEKRKEHGDS